MVRLLHIVNMERWSRVVQKVVKIAKYVG